MGYTILLVEDNPHIMEINAEALMMEGYEVVQAQDGDSCMSAVRSRSIDLAVLDIMLPDTDGLALCHQIKDETDIPIIFLTALGESEQVIEGLRAGGDDYLPKPYDIGVLLARIEARLRNKQQTKRYVNRMGLKLDTLSMTGHYGEQDLLLTQKEFLILLSLAEQVSGHVTQDELYRNIWGGDAGGDYSALHTTVSRLNKKLKDYDATIHVSFLRGEGYSLEEV